MFYFGSLRLKLIKYRKTCFKLNIFDFRIIKNAIKMKTYAFLIPINITLCNTTLTIQLITKTKKKRRKTIKSQIKIPFYSKV